MYEVFADVQVLAVVWRPEQNFNDAPDRTMPSAVPDMLARTKSEWLV